MRVQGQILRFLHNPKSPILHHTAGLFGTRKQLNGLLSLIFESIDLDSNLGI